jgi:hypothetical protein
MDAWTSTEGKFQWKDHFLSCKYNILPLDGRKRFTRTAYQL